MQPIIGLDFGNFNSFTCYISDFDIGTRMGGEVYDLLPPKLQDGIPSVYYYSKRAGVLLGDKAITGRAVPFQNRLRYLKRHLGENIKLDDRNISYDDAIVELIQYCVRLANEQMQQRWLVTTNIISLSYPATYNSAQRQRLIELVEKATLKDGQHLKVFGTITEPAAAALDYLAEFAKSDKDTTVLTYDLGGGTFDLSIVSTYPKGKKDSDGHVYYYDVINNRGISNLGGAEFDEIMFNLLKSKVNRKLSSNAEAKLKDEAEKIKVELSSSDDWLTQIFIEDDWIDINITRDEFEKASRDLLMKTINATKNILNEHPNQKPEIILLTGGASQMPMVMRELEKALPQYKGKIIFFRPSRAIAYGAARFGTNEKISDVTPNKAHSVVQRVNYNLGVRYYKDANDGKGYITTFIPAGTKIPFTSKCISSYKLAEGTYSTFEVYEANKTNPDPNEPDRDFTKIMSVTIEHGRKVPAGHPHESRLVVDKKGVLTIEARDTSVANLPFKKAHVQLQNLSTK